MRVSPFGHLRIKGYVHLPGAFRSLSRPSSALSAKASALRPSCLTFLTAIPFTIALANQDFLMNCAISLPAKGRYDTRSDRSDLDFLETFLNCFNHASDVFLSSTLLRLDIILLESFVYSVFKVRPRLFYQPCRCTISRTPASPLKSGYHDHPSGCSMT